VRWALRTRLLILAAVALLFAVAIVVTLAENKAGRVDEPWTLLGTTQDGRGLVIDHGGWGGCDPGPPRVRSTQDDTSIAVSVTQPEVDDGVACTAIGHISIPYVLRLGQPVGGRKIVGARRQRASGRILAEADRPSGRSFPMPSLIGLAAVDARDILDARGFGAERVGFQR